MNTIDVDPEGNETVWYANKVRLLHFYDCDRSHVKMNEVKEAIPEFPW